MEINGRFVILGAIAETGFGIFAGNVAVVYVVDAVIENWPINSASSLC